MSPTYLEHRDMRRPLRHVRSRSWRKERLLLGRKRHGSRAARPSTSVYSNFYHGFARFRPLSRRKKAVRGNFTANAGSGQACCQSASRPRCRMFLAVVMACLISLPVSNAWLPGRVRSMSWPLLSLSEDGESGSATTVQSRERTALDDTLWKMNASGSFASLLLKMGEQNRSYILEDDALEIDPVVGNRSTGFPLSSQVNVSGLSRDEADEYRDDSELLLTSLDWEAAKQIDESIIRVKQNLSELLSVREIPYNNPLKRSTADTGSSFVNVSTTSSSAKRSTTYQKRMERDQKLLVLQIASSISSVEEWKTVCELTDGIYPLLELIVQGANTTTTEQEEDAACRSARTLRDLCALSPELSAIITDDILRANVGWNGDLLHSLRWFLENSNDIQSPQGRHLRPAWKKQRETMQLYVAQLLLAISLASDDAVHAIRETSGLKDAVLRCSSFATKERRRRWLRYPKEVVLWLWKSRRKSAKKLRRPFVEAGSIGYDLNGQVQRTANQVLAAIGHNQWVPKIPGQRGLRILCMDGGGSRGMVAVTAVAALVEAAGEGLEVCDSFDLLAGTSTGAIISFLVGLRQETSLEAVERYNQLIRQIFVKSSFSAPLMLFTTATYDESPFMDILCNILGDDSMLDSRADPAVPLVVAVTSKMSSTPTHVALLRNYNYATGEFPDTFTVKPEEARAQLGLPLEVEHALIRNSPYKGAPLSSSNTPGERVSDASRHPGSFRVLQRYALRASTAAPTVFKPVMMGGEMYCDGGIVASNPTAVAIHEARALFPDVPIEMVVSIGTGAFIEQKSAPRIGWDGIIGQIVQSATDGEQVHHVLEDILGKLLSQPNACCGMMVSLMHCFFCHTFRRFVHVGTAVFRVQDQILSFQPSDRSARFFSD
jgi:hypothetical protein